MDTYYKQWKKALDDFQQSVEKELNEIRQHKAEVRQMKLDIIDRMNGGQYIRDDKRIVISAPEIVIGNVDKSGTLMKGYSQVIIRAGNVIEDGVGDNYANGGTILHRASSIRNICADPGTDGNEAVVGVTSEFVTQARSIVLHSEDAEGCFSSTAGSLGGVTIHADQYINIDATLPGSEYKKQVEATISGLKSQKDELKSMSADQKKTVDSLMDEIDTLLSGSDKLLNEDNSSTRANFIDIDEQNAKLTRLSSSLSSALRDCVNTLSCLAEVNRQIKCLDEKKKAIDSNSSDYDTKSTGAFVDIVAENIALTTADGNGKLRTNEGSGVGITAMSVGISSQNFDGSVIDKSSVSIHSQTVNVSTVNPKIESDGKGKVTKAEYPAAGDVNITSKNITMESVDYELKENKKQEKALTDKGSIKMRAETLDVSTNDTEGKATGSITLNSKSIAVKAMDVDKEKRTDSALAAGSDMLLLAEKMYVGSQKKDAKSKSVQIVSDKVGVFGDTTTELQQGEAKAVLQLDGGNAAISGSKTELYGETTMNGTATMKDKVTAPDVTITNLEVKTSFKTPYTTEGVSVPGAPSSAKLTAKLKEEELAKKQ